jgi:hypothetical protein
MLPWKTNWNSTICALLIWIEIADTKRQPKLKTSRLIHLSLTENVGLWKSSLKTVLRSWNNRCSGVSYRPSQRSMPPINAVIFLLLPYACVSTRTHFWWCVKIVPTVWKKHYTSIYCSEKVKKWPLQSNRVWATKFVPPTKTFQTIIICTYKEM